MPQDGVKVKSWLPDTQIKNLKSAGLTQEQISIVVHNLDKAISTRVITKERVEIVVHNIVNDTGFRREFFTNPIIAIEGLESKTGVNPKT